MKKILMLAVMLVVVPSLAQAATTCHSGTYKGKLWSVSPDINKKEATLVVQQKGTDCVANFQAEGATEEWTITANNTLVQKEYDTNGNVVATYKATLNGDKYFINCADKTKNVCDAGIDARNYWVLKTTPTTFTYTVYGVDSAKKEDATATVNKRHEFTFNKTN
ncbi:MAG: hypothetical protein ABH859_05415 [Pseudomonadota bacterium]